MKTCLAICFAALTAVGAARAMDLQGTISSTLTITEDSQLVGDVTCLVQGAACIQLAASNISLNFNGFTLTGQGNPPTGCFTGGTTTNIERGVVVIGQSDIEILGPGVIQGFRGWGILLNTTTNANVRRLTVRNNCLSGIQLGAANAGILEDLFCYRNGSPEAACGGICVASSNDNRLRRNLTSGNGYAVMSSVNFGIALEGAASGNVLEDNIIVGNANGIYLQAPAVNNVIMNNRVDGNPPIAIPAGIAGYLGFDIRNFAPAGANTFRGNSCVSYSGDLGTGDSPCPAVPLAPVSQ